MTVDSNCTLKTHVEKIRKQIRSRSWTLNALKQSGFSEADLVKVYTAYVRPLAEYASAAWGSMITKEQSDSLEQQQSQALKNIYGLGISARKMRDRAGLLTLEERRNNAMKKFALKNLNSHRFGHWFRERATNRERRSGANEKKYEEPLARTERYWNSPLNAMRRFLNSN